MVLFNGDFYDFVQYPDPIVNGFDTWTNQGVWELVNVTSYSETSFTPNQVKSQVLKFDFKFKRNHNYYLLTIFLPIQSLIFLQIIGIEIHPKDSNRSAFSVTIILGFSVVQNIVTSNVPKTSQTVYFFYYLFCYILFGTVITFYSVIVNKVSNLERCKKMVNRFLIIDRFVSLSTILFVVIVNLVYFIVIYS